MKGLKIALWICGIACLTSIPFAVLPWTMIENIFRWFGYKPIPDIPRVMYLFRIASGVFGLIGIYFIILAQNPLRYRPMLTLSAYGLIFFGLLSLIIELILKLSFVFYIGKALSALVLGIVILMLSYKLQRITGIEKEIGDADNQSLHRTGKARR